MSSEEEQIQKLTIYGTSGFFKFIKDNNILVFIIAAILSTCFNEFVMLINNELIHPIIENIIGEDLETKQVTIFGIKLNLGKFIASISKLTIIFLFVYIFYKIAIYLMNHKK